MQLITSSLIACLLACSLSTAQAQDFEGVITMTKHDEQNPKSTTFTVKDYLVLVQFQSDNGPVKVINDIDAGKTTSLFQKNGKKYAYISYEMANPEKPLDDRQKMMLELARKQVSIEVTDETRQIGKYLCTKIDGQDHKELVEAWVTDQIDLSLFDLFPSQQSPESESVDLQKMIWEEGFVIEYWTKNKETETVEKVTFDIAEKPVADDMFKYSKDEYYEFDEQTLNKLYTEAAKDPEKMEELRSLLEAFQSN